MQLLNVDALLKGKFARRVRAAALVAAAGIEWVAEDFDSAEPAEKVSRLVLQGADLEVVLIRTVTKAYELKVPMRGEDDIDATDEALIALVSELLVSAFGR